MEELSKDIIDLIDWAIEDGLSHSQVCEVIDKIRLSLGASDEI